jgi:hypothetical protein
MTQPATVRIKGAKWEALAGEFSDEPRTARISTLAKVPRGKKSLGGDNTNAIVLDLAVRHFINLQLSTTEAKRLGIALRRCLNGEAVDVGPVGSTGRTYNFRRKANAIAIRVGQRCMRLPLDAARALIELLQGAVSLRESANAG